MTGPQPAGAVRAMRPAVPVLAAVLALAAAPAAAAAGEGLAVIGPSGAVLLDLPVDGEWCLHWRHSVTGGAVADCFEMRDGRMILTRAYLHDFAAGLGHLPGRGTQRSAPGGGYWIDGIDEPVPGNALALRVGPATVGHRLVLPGGRSADLSALAGGQRVVLRPLSPGRASAPTN